MFVDGDHREGRAPFALRPAEGAEQGGVFDLGRGDPSRPIDDASDRVLHGEPQRG